MNKENNMAEILVLGDSIKNTGIDVNSDFYFHIKRSDFLAFVQNEFTSTYTNDINDLHHLPLMEINLTALSKEKQSEFLSKIDLNETKEENMSDDETE